MEGIFINALFWVFKFARINVWTNARINVMDFKQNNLLLRFLILRESVLLIRRKKNVENIDFFLLKLYFVIPSLESL